MNLRGHGWLFAAIYFLFMMGCFLGFSAISPPLRHQMGSIHSLFWTFALPWAAASCAVLSVGVWVVANLLEKRQRAKAH
jgi:hypothetical protein